MSDFKIVVTVKDIAGVRSLFGCRPDAFRINSSHTEIPALLDFLRAYPEFTTIPLYIDLQGSKLRVRRDQSEFDLVPGEIIFVGIEPHPTLKTLLLEEKVTKLIVQGSRVLLDDGKMAIEISKSTAGCGLALVLRGGRIRSGKGFNLVPHPVESGSLTDRDREIVEATKNFPFVRYALSFAALPEEVLELKKVSLRYVAVKVERELSMEQVESLAAVGDELWICRGDLGVQLGLAGLGRFFVGLNRKLSVFNVPVIMAGAVMGHMVENPRPTRSEVCHLAELKASGYAGIVLSNETVYGKYPVEVINCVREVTAHE